MEVVRIRMFGLDAWQQGNRGVGRALVRMATCPRHEIALEFGLTENRTAQLLFRAPRSLQSALDARA